MTAPEKIYVPLATWGIEYNPDSPDDIYVRKGTLIEWIDAQLTILDKQTLLHPDDDVFWGQRNAYKQMKDKLNSL